MAMLRVYPTATLPRLSSTISFRTNFMVRSSNSNLQLQMKSNDSHKFVLSVKEKLEKEHHGLPVGKNGRDDEDMILWFLKDRKFSVDEAVSKLTKAIKWRRDFEVSELTEEDVKHVAETGKAFVHDFLDVKDRPVLMVVASKHVPKLSVCRCISHLTSKFLIYKHLRHRLRSQDPADDEKLCVFLIEKALSKLPAGQEQILAIVDLRGFGSENVDLRYLTFLFDVFYYYYPKRLGQVLFVDAPFMFKPIWRLIKPVLKSYASVVRFCPAKILRKEYFTDETLPPNFRD